PGFGRGGRHDLEQVAYADPAQDPAGREVEQGVIAGLDLAVPRHVRLEQPRGVIELDDDADPLVVAFDRRGDEADLALEPVGRVALDLHDGGHPELDRVDVSLEGEDLGAHAVRVGDLAYEATGLDAFVDALAEPGGQDLAVDRRPHEGH